MSAFASCSKLILILTNILWLILGATLAGGGIALIYAPLKVSQLLEAFGTFSRPTLYSVIGVGAVISATAILGINAARTRKRSLLACYGLIVIIVIGFQVLLAYMIYTSTLTLDEAFKSAWETFNPEVRLGLQESFQCCGFESVNDTAVAGGTTCSGTALTGCKFVMNTLIQDYMGLLTNALYGIAGFEGILLISVVILFSGKKEDYDEFKV